jgi:hypothetical protein
MIRCSADARDRRELCYARLKNGDQQSVHPDHISGYGRGHDQGVAKAV